VYLAQAVDDHDRRRGPLQRSTELIEEEPMDRKNSSSDSALSVVRRRSPSR
jgi:hypothetical protein